MPKGTGWRISLIGIFILLSFLYLTPTLVTTLPSWWKGLLPKDKIHLGLDLQGGTHLVLEVDTQKAVEGTLDIVATDLEDTLNSKNLRFKRIARSGTDKVSVVLYEKGTAETRSRNCSRTSIPGTNRVRPMTTAALWPSICGSTTRMPRIARTRRSSRPWRPSATG